MSGKAAAVEDNDDEADNTTASRSNLTSPGSMNFGIGGTFDGGSSVSSQANSGEDDASADTSDQASPSSTPSPDDVKLQNFVTTAFTLPADLAVTAKTDKAGTTSDKDTAGAVSAPSDSLPAAGTTLLHPSIEVAATGFSTALSASGATSATTAQTPADQVSVVMQRAIASGTTSMTIALNPLELGKVEVKLDINKDGAVQANVIADRPETLTMLQNDHSSLHQALHNAGLTTDANSLNFSLRGDGQPQQQQTAQNGGNAYRSTRINLAIDSSTGLSGSAAQYAPTAADGRVDVLV